MAANAQPVPGANLAANGRLNKAGRRSGGLRKPRNCTREQLEAARKGVWDVADGRKIVCLICGVQMWGLGPVDKNRPGHLQSAHGISSDQYVAHCEAQGWGSPQVTSLRTRNKTTQWRHDHPDEVKGHNRQHHDRDQKKLTDADKADRVQCRLCGSWLRNLITQHLGLAHGMTKRRYLRQFPCAPLMAPDLLRAWEGVSELGHEKLQIRAPGRAPHRPRKDNEAERVNQLRTEGKSWKQLTNILNAGKKKEDQRTPDAYRSLWRDRYAHGEK